MKLMKQANKLKLVSYKRIALVASILIKIAGSLRSGSTNPTIRSEPNRRKEPDVMFRKLPRDKPLYYDTPNTSDSFIYYTSPQVN